MLGRFSNLVKKKLRRMFASCLLAFIGLIGVVIFCEYFIYFIYLYRCTWPHLERNDSKHELKIAFLADTHLLGIRKGHWFDKLRREWQMYRSFQTAMVLHEPDVVFILGDIFDEGSFSPDEVYLSYVERFYQLFNTTKKTELFVVAGNHDIGFHYAMHPYLEYRFQDTLKAPSVRMLARQNVNFILINSMALERDGCNICRTAEKNILRIRDNLRCLNGTGPCPRETKLRQYSRPIILLHFPLFRKNDEECEGSAQPGQPVFKEKWDCLSKDASEFLLDELNPRVVFTGHTHQPCRRKHRSDIYEFTIPSFNWRNTPNPSFIMAVFTEDQYRIHECHLPNEYFVIGFYVVFLVVIFTLGYGKLGKKQDSGLKKVQ